MPPHERYEVLGEGILEARADEDMADPLVITTLILHRPVNPCGLARMLVTTSAKETRAVGILRKIFNHPALRGAEEDRLPMYIHHKTCMEISWYRLRTGKSLYDLFVW